MPDKQKVHILGGGMAGLAAAHQLSNTQALRDRFDVTVYQRGWRLGGKCASSRAPHLADPGCQRIEEHGLHVWFGFYENAFAMLRDCFAELGHAGDAALQEVFMARSSTPLMEKVSGQWSLWPLDFPPGPDAGFPGAAPHPLALRDAVKQMMDYVTHTLAQLRDEVLRTSAVTDISVLDWLSSMASVDIFRNRVLGPVEHATTRFFDLVLNVFNGGAAPPNPLMSNAEMSWLQQFDATKGSSMWPKIQATIQARPPDFIGLASTLRRLWTIVDLVSAVLRGLAASAVPLLAEGLKTLDGEDFRRWLGQNGASDDSISSAPVRALYDLCFAYTNGDSTNFQCADFAAGTALRVAMRITMGYQTSVCYVLRRGMGEAVIAPVYQALVRRGVKFEFFTRVDGLSLDGQGRVASVALTRQAAVAAGAYAPTRDLQGIAYWPDKPDFGQLTGGQGLAADPSIDFDSDLGNVPPGTAGTIDLLPANEPPGKVVLAMSVGSLDGLSPDLEHADRRWATMLGGLRTVATQSAQLWMNRSLADLGYADAAHPPAMIAAPEPMDVWADMSHLAATERWTAAPASTHYLCGPMRNPAQPTQACALDMATRATASWLNDMAGSIWPHARLNGQFDWNILVAGAGAAGTARLEQQYIRANFEASERYVLSVAGSSHVRLAPDAFAQRNLFLAGDWTANGLDAGCVEAAVMSGIAAARALRGDPTFDFPGTKDV